MFACGLPENNLQGLAFSRVLGALGELGVLGVIEYLDEEDGRGALSGTKFMLKNGLSPSDKVSAKYLWDLQRP